jgi:glycosyltransferase involved in cell wall biosynthesis
MAGLRLLFASSHCYLDPGSGAALATRDLWELLAGRGHECRALCCGVLDYERESPLEAVFETLGVAPRPVRARRARGASAAFDLELAGVRVAVLPVASSRADRSPGPDEGAAYLELAGQALERFRPDALLTYGGHPADLELRRRARRGGVPVVFHLHNFAYDDARAFADASAVLVPSDYARRHYARRLGVEALAIPYPLRPERVVAADPEPRYLTFVNPQPAKGAAVFARIALELARRRPEIPLLVVEGRGAADGLARLPVDLSGLGTLHRMANTPDPRAFYRVSRAVLVPSLWRESFGRVAAEALANGLPVLASDRGALPETLGDAGFAFTIPDRCTPAGDEVPTAREVEPWLAVIERLWDDPAWYAEHARRAAAEAARWDAGRLAGRYEDLFRAGAGGPGPPPGA